MLVQLNAAGHSHSGSPLKKVTPFDDDNSRALRTPEHQDARPLLYERVEVSASCSGCCSLKHNSGAVEPGLVKSMMFEDGAI